MSQPKRHAYPSGRQDQYIVRFPDGMRERIKASAEKNCRTMNAEIIYQLGHVYGDEQNKKPAAES